MTRRGVLFDVDGTLIDSTYLHAITWWQAMRAAGHDATMAQLHRAIGAGSGEVVRQALGDDHDDEAVDLAAAQKALYSAHWPSLRPMAGARELLHRCRAEDLLVVLASSAPSREMAVLRRVLDADEFVDFVTTADDAERSKPEPDIIGVALERAGLRPEHAVLIGDAVWDVHAAAAAGVACIGLACGGTSEAELSAAGAVMTFEGPSDLLAHMDDVLGSLS